MSQDEIKAAAERYEQGYPSLSVNNSEEFETYFLPMQEVTDLYTLADAYLESLKTDSEPITDDFGVKLLNSSLLDALNEKFLAQKAASRMAFLILKEPKDHLFSEVEWDRAIKKLESDAEDRNRKIQEQDQKVAADIEPITEEWFLKIKGVYEDWTMHIVDDIWIRLYGKDVYLISDITENNLPHIKTRGQLTRLVAALRGE